MEKEPNLEPRIRTKERWGRWKRNLRLYYLRLLRLKGQPHEVAGGVAIGVFVGMTPTVPLHTVLAVLIALILKKSKLAAALGVWVANPFFLPFIYLLDYKVGKVLTGANASSPPMSHFSVPHLVRLGWDISYPLLCGGTVTGLLCAIPSYFITKRVILLYQAKRRQRKESP
jgi:uncharacterized protein (DUF2062 family)